MQHLKILNVLNKICSAFYILVGAGFTYFAYLGMQTGSIFAFVVPFVVALAIIGAGVFMWQLGGKLTVGQWRTGQIVVAALSLVNLPIGTAYGAYALWVCLGNDQAKAAYTELSEMEIFV